MESNDKLLKQVILFGFGLIGVATVIDQLLKKRLKPFVKVGVVRKLFIFPVKALKPIELTELEFNENGVHWKLLQDRAFMLVNRLNVMLSQRQEPRLTLLNVKLDYPYIIVSTPDESDSIKISLLDEDYEESGESKYDIIETNIWGDDVKGVDCGATYSQFFSNYFGKPGIKLLRFAPKLDHRPSQYYRDGKISKDPDIKIRYQETSVFHLINTKSVDTLNSWIESDEKVSFKNFRPNIVVEAEPFDEENWEKMRIGTIQFQQLLKCVRCRYTTIDTEKGIFMKQPLVTLKSKRPPKAEDLGYLEYEYNIPASDGSSNKKPSLPLMGVFFNPESYGQIATGSEVWVSHKRKSWFQ